MVGADAPVREVPGGRAAKELEAHGGAIFFGN